MAIAERKGHGLQVLLHLSMWDPQWLGRNTKINTKTRRKQMTSLKREKKEDVIWKNTRRKKKSAGMVISSSVT